MELFLLYFWLLIPTIHLWGSIITIACAIAWVISWPYQYDTDSRGYQYPPLEREARAIKATTLRIRLWFVFVPCFLICVFIPSKEDVAYLVAGHYALELGKSPEASKLVTVIRGKANEILDEQIKNIENKAVQAVKP